MQTETKFLLLISNFIEYSFSAVNVVLSKPSVGSLPRIKISFFLLSICTDKIISAPNIILFLLNPLGFDDEKLPRAIRNRACAHKFIS